MHQDDFARFLAECDRLGLGLVRAGRLADPPLVGMYSPADGATHLIVVAQTGPAYWLHLRLLQRADKELAHHSDPLDTMTRRLAGRLRGFLGPSCLGVTFPFETGAPDCVAIGRALGIGAPSRLAILIHPHYGPWIAFRMLFWVRDEHDVLPGSWPLAVSPCHGCSAPCAAACPANAFQGPEGVLNYESSFRYRLSHSGTCNDACAARLACPVGRDYRYPDDFLRHAHQRALAVARKRLTGATT